jgi:hypothetical protein
MKKRGLVTERQTDEKVLSTVSAGGPFRNPFREQNLYGLRRANTFNSADNAVTKRPEAI